MSGPGGWYMPDRLTNEHRACLLRAARVQLLKLKDEYDQLTRLVVEGIAASQVPADSAALELQCLQNAVAWLWRDQLAGDKD